MFDRWWEHAVDNYTSWEGGRAVAMDLYYDPVVDEHLASPIGLIAPVWYLAPQRREFAESAWTLAATMAGLLGDNQPSGLEDPNWSVMLAWHTGEFADQEVKSRLWEHLDESFEPTWDRELGEFTFRFGFDEPYPRGQLNARAMAGWVCTPGAWSRIFNTPDLDKFEEPTISGVDFPRVALSEARWDGAVLHLAAHPQNAAVANTRTRVDVGGLPSGGQWELLRPDGSREPIDVSAGATELDLVVDGGRYGLRRR
ncbi:MAG: hypothetical protein QGI28_05580 [Acidimicrobiales bacterium]|nr:hypothetical protein [Acidimicrobiales bacterium]